MNTIKNLFRLRVILPLIAFTLIIVSCDQIKELITISISTTLEGNIPLVATKSSSGITKASAVNYGGSKTISIADNPDLKEYLKKIKEVNIQSVNIKITGLKQDQTIDFLKLDVTGIGEIASIKDVTMNNNSFLLTISSDLIKSISDKLVNNNSITVNLTSGANSIITANIELKMAVKVKAQVLD